MNDLDFLKTLSNEAVLLAGLVVFGKVLKDSPVSNWIIPHLIGIVGIIAYQLMVGSGARNAMIGLCIAGLAVYGHQVVKQWKDARASGDTEHFTKSREIRVLDPPASEPMERDRQSNV